MKKVSPIMRRHRIFSIIFGIMLLITLGFILYGIDTGYLNKFSERELWQLRKNFAVAGAILFAGSGLLFCVRVFLKYTTVKGFESFARKINLKVSQSFNESFLEGDLIKALRILMVIIGKIVQNLHVIFVLLGTICISIHVYIAFTMNIKFTVGYIAGYIALVLLILLVLSSTRRIFNKAIKSHKWLGVWFIIFMGIHLLFVKP